MRQFSLVALFGLLLLAGVALAQDDAAADAAPAADGEGGEGEEGAKEEECEEAWDYVEFMKASVK